MDGAKIFTVLINDINTLDNYDLPYDMQHLCNLLDGYQHTGGTSREH